MEEPRFGRTIWNDPTIPAQQLALLRVVADELKARWEDNVLNCLGFVQLGCIVILLRRGL